MRDSQDAAPRIDVGRSARGTRLSDINIEFEWWELVLVSPMLGWPGLLVGAVAGAIGWKTRPILGGVLGAIAGNFAFALARIYFM
jgi:hypothetical protein